MLIYSSEVEISARCSMWGKCHLQADRCASASQAYWESSNCTTESLFSICLAYNSRASGWGARYSLILMQ